MTDLLKYFIVTVEGIRNMSLYLLVQRQYRMCTMAVMQISTEMSAGMIIKAYNNGNSSSERFNKNASNFHVAAKKQSL